MSRHKPWREIAHKNATDPARAENLRREMERNYNRPWWRLVRFATRTDRPPT